MEGLKRKEILRGWEVKDVGVKGEGLEKGRWLGSGDFKMYYMYEWNF